MNKFIPNSQLEEYIHHSFYQFLPFILQEPIQYTFHVDDHPVWDAFRPLVKDTVLEHYDVALCGYEVSLQFAMKHGTPYCLSILETNVYDKDIYAEFPLFHVLRVLIKKTHVPFLSTCSLLWIAQPEPNHLYFNSSIVGSKFITRFSPTKFGPSGLFYSDTYKQILYYINDYDTKHLIFEDPRLFVFQNIAYVAVSVIKNYTAGVHTSCRLGYFPVESLNPEKDLTIPLYGKNKETGPEKSWGFFEGVDGGLYALYSYSPWTILRIHTEAPENVEEVVKDGSIKFASRTHGGACPVQIGDSFWTFGRNEGGIVCVVFDAKTFSIKAHCIPSFLSAKALSYMHFFIGSAEYDPSKDIWKCVGGFNDAGNCVLRFSHSALVQELHWV